MTRRVTQCGILITMPEWQADALVLSTRPHGEGSVVVTVLTAGGRPACWAGAWRVIVAHARCFAAG